uniref:Ig-like domain-containing protein n=1 Tax=Sinocyclocheilus grahami TaxID=75366 RepID=A0A672LJK0_SINGR
VLKHVDFLLHFALIKSQSVLNSTLHHCTLTDKPQPTLSVKPQSSVFTGDTVTLSCDVGQLTGWTINWRKDSNPESTGDATKTIKSVSVSDGGVYKCIAERGNSYSEYSNAVTITVKGQHSLYTFYTFFNGRQLCVC